MEETHVNSSQDEMMNSLLERLRKERFTELNQTVPNEHQFRDTVTRLDSFFGRYNPPKDLAADNSKSSTLTSSSARAAEQVQNGDENEDTETSQAEVVSETVVEIQTLVNQRLVSSVLMRGDLRNRLESTLGAMRSLLSSNRLSNTERRRQRTPPSATVASPARPTATARVTTSPAAAPATVAAPAYAPVAQVTATQPGTGAPPIPQRFVEPRVEIQNELEGLNNRQPVSRLLESGFAERLTDMIVNHLHLVREGLQPNQNSDDNISIISSQTTVSTNANSGAVTRLAKQVKSMRSEMNELKSMLGMLMDAQQETHRLIKHELAPRVQRESRVPRDNRMPYYKEASPSSSINGPTATANDSDNGSLDNPLQRGKCLICFNKPAAMMVYRCGHLCMCYECSLQLRRMHNTVAGRVLPPHGDIPADLKCPVCRGEVLDLVKVFSDRF